MSANVCIPGISGRMGLEITKVLLENSNLHLSSGVVRNINQIPKKMDLLDLDKDKLSSDLSKSIVECDICIDFTRPNYSMEILEICKNNNKSLIIGTTGYSKKDIQMIESASKLIPILKSSNMSVGINLCLELAARASSAIGENSDIDIIEHHHKHKVDMPSGTSLSFEDRIKSVLKKEKEINHHCLRVGNVVGDHTVKFTLQDESIEIHHKSFDRKIFANGAVLAAEWILNKEPGLYNMSDVLAM